MSDTFSEWLDEMLGNITGSMVDENIMPHKKYEDAVSDEDIVLLGQQLLDDARDAILKRHKEELLAARVDELNKFEPLQKTHDKCPDPKMCISYMNAVSDFDNEKAIRLAQLQASNNTETPE